MASRGDSSTARGRRIQVLDARLANQIAAGEVVERPASVLKELMENALDAGATRIQVQVERGGMARIRVRDDGAGIHRDDLRLALERHATSKVASLDELESVQTLGFRGEALPSIASVSRALITSRLRGCAEAWCVQVDEEHTDGVCRPASHPAGTSVEVRDLFYNTPARRRFLRTERTEMRHLEQVFRRIALSRMDVAMTLVHNEREVLRVGPAETDLARQERARRILRAGFMDDVHRVSLDRDELSIDGWVRDARGASARPDQQYLFVNRRPVMDTTVRHAVRLAFGERVAHGAHPGWVLFLGMPPAEVDVNVHPTKQEVRFHEARRVHDFVRFAVAHALGDGQSRIHAVPDPARAPGIADAPRATVASAPAEQPAALRPVALLEHRLLVARDGGDLMLASVPALVAANVRRTLGAAVRGELVITRPLLLPARFEWTRDADSLERMARALERLGVVVRLLTPGVAALQSVPRCLEAVPVAALCAALAAPPIELADLEAWVEHLCAACVEARLRNAEQAVALLEAARQAQDDEGARPWRRFPADELARLIEND